MPNGDGSRRLTMHRHACFSVHPDTVAGIRHAFAGPDPAAADPALAQTGTLAICIRDLARHGRSRAAPFFCRSADGCQAGVALGAPQAIA
jgi:hypothetical protein